MIGFLVHSCMLLVISSTMCGHSADIGLEMLLAMAL